MILPLVFYLLQVTTIRWVRTGLLAAGFLLIVATVLTYSRGAFIGISAMGLVFWLRSPSKIKSAVFILVTTGLVYSFAPDSWFERMQSTENYEVDASALGRITMWQIGLEIAANRPVVGGGFRITFWPDNTKRLIGATADNYAFFDKPRAEHSIYFDVLSEHGYVGLMIFLIITFYSMYNCFWLVRKTRRRSDLVWANLLGRMGQGVLVGYWVCGAFLSQAYLDEYWCMVFLFDAARRVVTRELTAGSDRIERLGLLNLPRRSALAGTELPVRSRGSVDVAADREHR